MRVLGIETSCDDTSVALFDSDRGVAENLVSSQVDIHDVFGGVVPELASRAHLVNLLPLVDTLLRRSGMALTDLDGVAVTAGPGLIGALLVGLSTGKALAMARRLDTKCALSVFNAGPQPVTLTLSADDVAAMLPAGASSVFKVIAGTEWFPNVDRGELISGSTLELGEGGVEITLPGMSGAMLAN